MTVRAVLWDADGVLQRVPHGGEESMRSAVEGRVDDVEAFLADAVARERPALCGRVRWLDVLPGLLARWGIGEAYDDLVAAWLAIEEVPGSRALAAAVRAAGVPCYLASNQDRHRAQVMEERLGYRTLLDGSFYSCDLGVAKPDPAYFSLLARRLRLPPAALVLIDDSHANVAAAAAVGLRAARWSSQEDTDVLAGHLVRLGVPIAGACF